MGDIIKTFTECLLTMSYARAGWDYQMSASKRQEEAAAERKALETARKIWADNQDRHDDLRRAFADAQPLASMTEIERAA